MITKLTKAQIARFPEFVDRWIKIGLCTDPADFASAELAMRKIYRLIGRPDPIIVRVGSPLACGLGYLYARSQVVAQVDAQVDAQVRDQVVAQVRDQVVAQVDAQVGDQVGAQVRAQVRDQVVAQVVAQVDAQVRAQVGAQVVAQVDAQVDAQVRAQVRDQVVAQVRDQVGDQVGAWDFYRGAQLWAGWYAYIAFFRDVCGWDNKILAKFDLDEMIALSCGWSWWANGIGLLSDRPRRISRDQQHRLHSVAGPALAYPDGWAIYAWHGVRIPGEWVEHKDKIDPRLALTHANIEQRTALASILGWQRILSVLQPKVIDADRNPQIGSLIEVDLPDAPGSRFLRVRGPGNDGPDSEYVLGVPRECQTAREANARTYGLTPSQFKPGART